jgi:hypothetical protein
VKRIAALVIAVGSVTIPAVASAASVTPAGVLPEQACSAAAPGMGALSGTPAAPVLTTLCSK